MTAPTTTAMPDHVAVVVGGTSGIGARVAARFVAEGATVVVAGRRRPEGEELAARLGPAARFVSADVTREADVAALVAGTVDRHGRIDSVVVSAGVTGFLDAVADADLDDLARMMAVHAGGVLAVLKHAGPALMAQRSGSIVNIASVAGRLGGWTGHAYAASKAAVLQLTRTAAVELGEHGVRVNSISPGPIPTGVFGKRAGIDARVADRTAGALGPAFAAAMAGWQPMPGAGTPDDVASAALWLAGDGSRWVTGHDLVVDGGLSAGRPASAAGDGGQLAAALLARRGEGH
jgi:NAD(P)-dependent dehydrogenase (short-subunit alcohol dehydrogenase family)